MILNALMKIFSIPMPGCRHVSRLSSQAEDRRLTFREAVSLRAHLSVCALCREYRRQIRLIRIWIRRRQADASRASHSASLSEEARARIRTALRNA